MLFLYSLATPTACYIKTLLAELLSHWKTQIVEIRRTYTFPGYHFKIKFLSLTVTGRHLKVRLSDYRNPLECPLSSDNLGTWHNLLTFSVDSSQQTNQSTLTAPRGKALCVWWHPCMDSWTIQFGIQRSLADVLCHTAKKISTALNLRFTSIPSRHVTFVSLCYHSR